MHAYDHQQPFHPSSESVLDEGEADLPAGQRRLFEARGAAPSTAVSPRPRLARLNAEWHRPALAIFMVVVFAHLAEHVVQIIQIHLLGWAVADSRGVLGQWYPWMVESEVLHYAYALVMLAGLWLLRRGFAGQSRMWWLAALGIQFWHHIEHLLLQAQALLGANLLGRAVPTSLVQLWVPRAELHLLYNTLVLVPMLAAVYLHRHPTAHERTGTTCACAAGVR